MDSCKDKNGNELRVGDKFKRDHGRWKDKDVFTVRSIEKGYSPSTYRVWSVEDGLNSLSNSIYKVSDGKRYIVVVEQNGKLAPASTPKEYASRNQAESVAESMADKHGGKFFVFEAVALAKAPERPKAEVVAL